MLRGEQGRQAKELQRLVEWLNEPDNKPDVVVLSNILLAGVARRIKARLDVPVLSLLQDEDSFLDALTEPYAKQAWQMLAERAEDVDAFIAVSKYYADVMKQRLRVNAERMHVVHMGISLDAYDPPPGEPDIPTIGYLSRMCPDKGLDMLVDAFISLKRNEKLKNTRLQIAGGQTPNDKAFIGNIRQELDSHGLSEDVEFLPTLEHKSKVSFLRTLSVLSVPEKRPIAYGLYVLEALAAGVPVVEPAIGAFCELLEMTGGGVLYEPNDAEALVAAIQPLLFGPNYAHDLGKKGRENVFAKFNIEQTAQKIERIYKQFVHH